MREIKFRVWDTINKEYEDASDFHIDLSNGNLYEVVPVPTRNPISAGIVTTNNQNRYILEQYTGLKDGNGVEIYEGDILKHTFFTWLGNCVVRFGEYDNGEMYEDGVIGYGWYTIEDDNEKTIQALNCAPVEVIGNINEGLKNER